MLHVHPHPHPESRHESNERLGSILVLSATVLVMVLALTAFAVDIGYIALTATQLQNASDGAALAAAIEMLDGLAPGDYPGQNAVLASATSAASAVATANRAGDSSTVYLDPASDIAYGHREWNSETGTWTETWGSAPYNIVRVTAHRDRGTATGGVANTKADRPLPLFVAPVIGTNNANLQITATAALQPASGFYLPPSSSATCGVLPITFDLPSWEAMSNGSGSDNYAYNPTTKLVTPGSDGILEIDLYPYGNQALTPGNRGTVCIGASNNSTATLNRQILYGLNATDLSYYANNTLTCGTGTLSMKGNPGLSAGIKAALETIIGQPRAIPIFTEVSGQGNNTTYTIVKFVGIRILHVQLTGGNKVVVAQPALYSDGSMTVTPGVSTNEYLYLPPRLIH